MRLPAPWWVCVLHPMEFLRWLYYWMRLRFAIWHLRRVLGKKP